MTAVIPNSHKDLLEGPVYAVVTTVMPDGQPQSTVVWADYDGEYVRINTAKGRQKYKNLIANPKVTLVAVDPTNPYRWIEVRGQVAEMTENGGKEHIHTLSRLYTGQQYYGGYAPAEREAQETRVLIKIKPSHVTIYGR